MLDIPGFTFVVHYVSSAFHIRINILMLAIFTVLAISGFKFVLLVIFVVLAILGLTFVVHGMFVVLFIPGFTLELCWNSSNLEQL